MTISLQSGTSWVFSYYGGFYNGSNGFGTTGGGSITLSGVVTTVTLTSVSADTFIAGSINIFWE